MPYPFEVKIQCQPGAIPTITKSTSVVSLNCPGGMHLYASVLASIKNVGRGVDPFGHFSPFHVVNNTLCVENKILLKSVYCLSVALSVRPSISLSFFIKEVKTFKRHWCGIVLQLTSIASAIATDKGGMGLMLYIFVILFAEVSMATIPEVIIAALSKTDRIHPQSCSSVNRTNFMCGR